MHGENLKLHSVSVTKTNRLVLCRENISCWCGNHMKYINTFGGPIIGFLNVKHGGTCSSHWTYGTCRALLFTLVSYYQF